jgi:hypothetical protein
MLARSFDFGEEAMLNTFIALVAAFQLVLGHLVRSGCRNRSENDAADWLY